MMPMCKPAGRMARKLESIRVFQPTSNMRVELHAIKQNTEAYVMLSEVCAKAKLLYNSANYYQKQAFIQSGYNFSSLLTPYKLRDVFIGTEVYKAVGGHIAAEVCFQVARNWKSYKENYGKWLSEYTLQVKQEGIKYKRTPTGLIRRNTNGEPVIDKSTRSYLGEPRCPRYNRGEMNGITLDCGGFRQGDGFIRFPKRLGSIIIPTTRKEKIRNIRIRPVSGRFIIEFVYGVEIPDPLEDNGRYFGIDLGIDNFAAVVSNTGMQPVTVDGRVIKSKNQFWNKVKAHFQEVAERMNGTKHTARLDRLARKRNAQVKDFIHKATRYIVDLAVSEQACEVFIGKNPGWKQKVNLGKKTNQTFTQLPFAQFIEVLTYKCAEHGIKVTPIDEAHTSKSSFLDNEPPQRQSEYVGRRVCRGLFRTAQGLLINADVNAAYQMIRKAEIQNVASRAQFKPEIGRGCSLHPIRVAVA